MRFDTNTGTRDLDERRGGIRTKIGREGNIDNEGYRNKDEVKIKKMTRRVRCSSKNDDTCQQMHGL